MISPKYFKFRYGKIKLPVFFPDATRGVIKTVDTSDIEATKTLGILINTYHLYKDLGIDLIRKAGGVRKFMDYQGAVISDSGGFQVGSLIKENPKLGKVTDKGVEFRLEGTKVFLTPEKSIEFQMELDSDMVIVLDDFTPKNATYREAKISIERTIDWAERGKKEFEKRVKEKSLKTKPYILGVVQGGRFQDLREYCLQELIKIGFDGVGYGGWPINADGKFDMDSAKTIALNSPKNYFLYGLGVGKPEDIVKLSELGFSIFDCVLPTRDARHGRLYLYNAKDMDDIDVKSKNFYSLYDFTGFKNLSDIGKISTACDCLLCTRYTKGYLTHLNKIGEFGFARLATIHNLRFYSILREKLASLYF